MWCSQHESIWQTAENSTQELMLGVSPCLLKVTPPRPRFNTDLRSILIHAYTYPLFTHTSCEYACMQTRVPVCLDM